MDGMNFHRVEPCFLCVQAGLLETDQRDYLGQPETIECPCCMGTGELRIYGNRQPPNN